MKKIIYLLLAVVVMGVYSCQKDNTAPAAKSLNNLSLKGKKDTVPPDPSFNTFRVKKDTVPPDPSFNTLRTKKDTVPPDPSFK